KQRLSYNPKELNLKGKYTFLITKTEEISAFLKKVRGDYRILVPLPKQYSDLNFMNKPDLLDNPKQITYIKIKVPIVTTEHWIKISKIIPNPHKTTDRTKLRLPKTIEDLKEIIDHYPLHQAITLLIDKYENISETTEILRTYFQLEDLLPYMLQLPDLLKYEWQIFDNDNDI
ncbi:7582_t:CDS:2, partial [Gigaspora rosea]